MLGRDRYRRDDRDDDGFHSVRRLDLSRGEILGMAAILAGLVIVVGLSLWPDGTSLPARKTATAPAAAVAKPKPPSPQRILNRAFAYFRRGQYKLALEGFHRYLAVAQKPEDKAMGFACIARLERSRGDFEAATKAVAEAVKADSRWIPLEAVLAVEAGDLARAHRLRDQVTTAAPKASAGTTGWLEARLALARGDASAAIAGFQKLSPSQGGFAAMSDFQTALAEACMEAGRTSDAIREYERLLKEDPKNAIARHRLAEALEKAGRPEEALRQEEIFLQTWRDADPDAPGMAAAQQRLRTGAAGAAAAEHAADAHSQQARPGTDSLRPGQPLPGRSRVVISNN